MSFIGPELPLNYKHEDEPSEKGPQVHPHLLKQSTVNIIYDEDDDDDDDDGPKPAVTIGPSMPVEFSKVLEYNDDGDDNGPELPPHLRKGRLEGPSTSTPGPSTGKRQVGPTFPSYAPTYDPTTYHDDEDDDDDDDFGPKPLPAGMQHQQTDAVKEFIEREEKRRELAEVCNKGTISYFTKNDLLMPFLSRTLPNPRVCNGMNGCLSHLPRQVFSEVSNNGFFFSPT